MKWFRLSFYSGAISLVFFVDYQLNSADSKAASDSRIEEIEKLREKADEFFKKGEYAKTLELMKQTLSLSEGAFGASHTNLASILDITAGLYRTLGNFSNATALCERSLAIRESAFGSESPEVATSLFELASLQLDQGSYATALQLCQRSIQIREKSFGKEHPDVAAGFSILARIYTKQGDYFRALEAVQRAFAYWDKHFEINPYLAVTCLADMASINQDLGNFDSSLRLYQAVAALYEKVYGPDTPHLAACWNNIASIYEMQWNYAEALTFYQRSLTLKVKVFGLEHPDVAFGLNNSAKMLAQLGSYAEAMKLYQHALLIVKKTFGDTHPNVATVLNNIAELYEEQGDTSNALPLLERSLQINQTALGKEHPRVASVLNNLASVYESQGKVQEALSYYERSLAMKERAFGTNHPEVISILRNIAVLRLEQGDVGNALEAYAEAFRRRRSYLVVQYSLATDKEAIRTIERDRFSEELFHSLCRSRAASGSAPVLGSEQLALNKALLEEVRVAQAALESDLATATQELRHQRQNALIRLERLPEGRLEPRQQAETRRTIEAELKAIDVKLSDRVGRAVRSLGDQNVTISEIARSVPLDSVLVDIVQFLRFEFAAKTNWNEQRYSVYLTFPLTQDSTNIVVERVDLGEAAPINDAVEELCKLIASGQIAPKRLQPVLQRLGELVYAPLAKYLTNIEHLIVCPDGQLNRLPFEILLPNGADGKYLVEEKTISYVGSGREIVRLAPNQASSKPKARSSPSLVMGDPDFDLDLSAGSTLREEAHSLNSELDARNSEFGQSLLTSAATSGVHTLSRSARGLKFAPLPAAAEEARSIANLLGTETTLRLGAEARERELKSVVSPRVLHLATHGFFLSDQEFARTNELRDSWMEKLESRWNGSLPKNDWENPLVRCGVALAGANHALQITNAVAEDGLLTGLEAALLNLQGTELVILSACDTGTGEVKIGEGVMSLRRSFRIAGAESVLASHWKVSDKATSQLMTEFMRRWRSGEPRAKAWREAQLSLLRSKDFSNPFFWGAFTLTGQWR